VPTVTCTHVEVYLFRHRARRVEFLALRRAPGRTLPGVWQPVTGRIRRGEGALAAAAREVREETGLVPRRWWALETTGVFYDAGTDRVLALPLFAAEVGAADAVRLSAEHDAWAFLSAPAAARRWLWNAQRRGLRAVKDEVLAGGRLARALEVAPPGPRSVSARASRRTHH
jgi:dATP pyrophosphohydrolase